MKFERIADLDTLSDRCESDYNVILLHGFGADFQDLAGLRQMIPLPKRVNWFFPNGPIEVALGPHMTGRAWFPIDMAALEAAMIRGEARYFADKIPDEMPLAIDKLADFLQIGGFDPSKTFVGGFSQGAMICSHAVLKHSLPIACLVQLSGTLVGHQLLPKTESNKLIEVFQSHGSQDPILPYQRALDLKIQLEQICHSVEFHSFQGGHEIPVGVLQALSQKLSKLMQ